MVHDLKLVGLELRFVGLDLGLIVFNVGILVLDMRFVVLTKDMSELWCSSSLLGTCWYRFEMYLNFTLTCLNFGFDS